MAYCISVVISGLPAFAGTVLCRFAVTNYHIDGSGVLREVSIELIPQGAPSFGDDHSGLGNEEPRPKLRLNGSSTKIGSSG